MDAISLRVQYLADAFIQSDWELRVLFRDPAEATWW